MDIFILGQILYSILFLLPWHLKATWNMGTWTPKHAVSSDIATQESINLRLDMISWVYHGRNDQHLDYIP